jgi:mannose-6-phosphate isomerase-like protein (cupin superfamily)
MTTVVTGQTIENPISGEHITFLKTARETNGASFLFDCRVPPGMTPLPAHIHMRQEERFEVISGTLDVLRGHETFTLSAGQQAVLPAGIKHQWRNAGPEDVYFRVEVVPAGNIERVLEAVAGMARDGKMTRTCRPKNPFRLAQFARLAETYMPGIPIWMQKVGLALGCTAARVLGYDPTFAEYATLATGEPALAVPSDHQAA